MPSTIHIMLTRIACALCLVLVFCAPVVRAAEDPEADAGAADYDARMRDFDTQIRNIQNTPTDLCDPVAMDAQKLAWLIVSGQKHALRDQQEKKHPTGQQAAKAAADAMADEGMAMDFPQGLQDYEAAMKRGDTVAADTLLKKMTPYEQSRAAESQNDYPRVYRILTPLADQGDVQAQRRLAVLYSWDTNFDMAKIHKTTTNIRDDALAFKYALLGSLNGDEISQEVLAKAYACGLGTPKDLVKAYAWFSLAVSQSALMLKTEDVPQALLRQRDFIAALMSHDDIQRAKHLLMACHRSQYKACD